MVKKTLSSEDQNLFRQTIGKVRSISSDKLLLNKEKKPKPYPKPLLNDVDNHFITSAGIELEKVGIEDSMRFIAPGLQNNILKNYHIFKLLIIKGM